MPTPPTEPPHHFSPSAADTFEDCQQKWYAKYVMRVPDPAGPEAEVGTMAHEVLEELCLEPSGHRTPEAAKAISRRLWASMPVAQRRAAWGHVVRALRNVEVSHGDVVSVEQTLEVPLAGVPFKGILDRADSLPSGAVRILDYKTGKRPGRADWMAGKRRTLMLYSAAYEVVEGRPVHEAALVWTASGKVDDYEVDDIEIAGAVRWFRQTWETLLEALDRGRFEADPGPLCSWCPGAASCPEGQEAILERARAGKSIGPFGEPIVAAAVATT